MHYAPMMLLMPHFSWCWASRCADARLRQAAAMLRLLILLLIFSPFSFDAPCFMPSRHAAMLLRLLMMLRCRHARALAIILLMLACAMPCLMMILLPFLRYFPHFDWCRHFRHACCWYFTSFFDFDDCLCHGYADIFALLPPWRRRYDYLLPARYDFFFDCWYFSISAAADLFIFASRFDFRWWHFSLLMIRHADCHCRRLRCFAAFLIDAFSFSDALSPFRLLIWCFADACWFYWCRFIVIWLLSFFIWFLFRFCFFISLWFLRCHDACRHDASDFFSLLIFISPVADAIYAFLSPFHADALCRFIFAFAAFSIMLLFDFSFFRFADACWYCFSMPPFCRCAMFQIIFFASITPYFRWLIIYVYFSLIISPTSFSPAFHAQHICCFFCHAVAADIFFRWLPCFHFAPCFTISADWCQMLIFMLYADAFDDCCRRFFALLTLLLISPLWLRWLFRFFLFHCWCFCISFSSRRCWCHAILIISSMRDLPLMLFRLHDLSLWFWFCFRCFMMLLLMPLSRRCRFCRFLLSPRWFSFRASRFSDAALLMLIFSLMASPPCLAFRFWYVFRFRWWCFFSAAAFALFFAVLLRYIDVSMPLPCFHYAIAFRCWCVRYFLHWFSDAFTYSASLLDASRYSCYAALCAIAPIRCFAAAAAAFFFASFFLLLIFLPPWCFIHDWSPCPCCYDADASPLPLFHIFSRLIFSFFCRHAADFLRWCRLMLFRFAIYADSWVFRLLRFARCSMMPPPRLLLPLRWCHGSFSRYCWRFRCRCFALRHNRQTTAAARSYAARRMPRQDADAWWYAAGAARSAAPRRQLDDTMLRAAAALIEAKVRCCQKKMLPLAAQRRGASGVCAHASHVFAPKMPRALRHARRYVVAAHERTAFYAFVFQTYARRRRVEIFRALRFARWLMPRRCLWMRAMMLSVISSACAWFSVLIVLLHDSPILIFHACALSADASRYRHCAPRYVMLLLFSLHVDYSCWYFAARSLMPDMVLRRAARSFASRHAYARARYSLFRFHCCFCFALRYRHFLYECQENSEYNSMLRCFCFSSMPTFATDFSFRFIDSAFLILARHRLLLPAAYSASAASLLSLITLLHAADLFFFSPRLLFSISLPLIDLSLRFLFSLLSAADALFSHFRFADYYFRSPLISLYAFASVDIFTMSFHADYFHIAMAIQCSTNNGFSLCYSHWCRLRHFRLLMLDASPFDIAAFDMLMMLLIDAAFAFMLTFHFFHFLDFTFIDIRRQYHACWCRCHCISSAAIFFASFISDAIDDFHFCFDAAAFRSLIFHADDYLFSPPLFLFFFRLFLLSDAAFARMRCCWRHYAPCANSAFMPPSSAHLPPRSISPPSPLLADADVDAFADGFIDWFSSDFCFSPFLSHCRCLLIIFAFDFLFVTLLRCHAAIIFISLCLRRLYAW